MPRPLRPCPTHGCPHFQPCPAHPRTPWAGSDRARRLPPNWQLLRRRVLRRDGAICHLCHLTGANEVDHLEAGDNHAMSNLAAVHTGCHMRKSSAEGHAARRQQPLT